MAPVFPHGKGAKLLLNRYNMTPFINDGTVHASCDTADTTTWGKNDKTYIPGLGDVTASFNGLFAANGSSATSTALNKILDTQIGGSTKLVLTYAPEGDTVGNWAVLVQGDETKYDIKSPAAGLVSLAFDVQGSGGMDGGVWLRPLSTGSSTGSNTGVALPGSTAAGGAAGGGVGHFHLVSASTLTTGLTAKIQHSTSGSTWADLITFTLSTAETFQRSTVSGTIKERLRATCSAMTGGASKTATWGIAFARRGTMRG